MTDFLETRVDKFIFRVATDRFYNPEGVWAKEENGRIRIGLTDFVQQRSGDVTFVEVKPIGSALSVGDEAAVIETIKVNISFTSPLSGTIVDVNPEMAGSPEVINQDPFGAGWLAEINPIDWVTDRARLLDPKLYFNRMKSEAESKDI